MVNWIKRRAQRSLDALADRLSHRIYDRIEAMGASRTARALDQVVLRGTGGRVGSRLVLTGARFLSLGNNVHIGDDAYIRAEGGLVIGDNTHISRRVTIYTVNHEYEGRALPYDERHRHRSVVIGKNVWIGMGANIVPGARIGDGAIVGMGATVAGVVPPRAIVGAPKAIPIGERDAQRYDELERSRRYGGASGRPLSFEGSSFVPGLDSVTPLFIVSTGRSGSTTIARTLNQHPRVTAVHEPHRSLIRLSTEWAHGLRDPDLVRAELYATYDASVCPGPDVFAESDQNLSVLLDPLLSRAHHARVLWLVRDGRDVVSSALRKGWYQGGAPADNRSNAWDDYRLRGDLCGEVEKEAWEGMTAFEKNCWYWSYVNRAIESSLAQVPSDRWLFLRLEGLAHHTDDVFELAGVDPVPVHIERHNAGRGPKPVWSASEAEAFETWCGPAMDQWYPGWRTGAGDPC